MYVKGGFTPFKSHQVLSGLGAMGDDLSDLMNDPALIAYQNQHPGDVVPAGGVSLLPSQPLSTIAGIPSWALLIGGFLVAALILPTGRR